MNEIIQGDCLEKLKELPENSVDSIVTDPPYHLVSIVNRFGKENSAPAKEGKDGSFKRLSGGFMGKTWDGLGEDGIGIANNPKMWAECLRVLKPGGHLLSFSGTRTYHRMACAIEDAGFEVRDMIEWVYGSGFPKSRNIGLDVDKRNGVTKNRGKAFVVAGQSGQRDKDTGGDLVPGSNTMGAYVAQNEWSGWGTALKPAHEPICMARKPLSEKTVAENCLKFGTGGINIDESRVDGKTEIHSNGKRSMYGGNSLLESKTHNNKTEVKDYGRFPANLLHDNSEEVRECFPETKSGSKPGQKGKSILGSENGETRQEIENAYGDSGNASRFFRAIPQVVDYNDFLIYNRSILTNIKQLCGQHLTKKKTDIILDGVIKEAEKFIQDAELLMSGNSTTEKFLTDTASTIKTLIAQMTELKTLNVLPSWLIMKFTEDYEKTIKLLKELNTEDVKNAESINHLIVFKREMLELIRDTVKSVAIRNSDNGKLQTENELMLTPENINENTKKNIGERKSFKSIIYTAKASKSERNMGCERLEDTYECGEYGNGLGDVPKVDGKRPNPVKNFHPTVKPIALMEYLIKMVTRKGRTCLDPFMGSGSTGVACILNGYNFIGIERELDYIKIAEARIKEAEEQYKKNNQQQTLI